MDLHAALKDLERYSRGRDPNDASDAAWMSTLSERRVMQVLYARLLIFSEFLQIASEQPGGITDKHKERWLLLQVAPKTLIESDIFHDIYFASGVARFADLQTQCVTLLDNIKKMIGCLPVCILDEAQRPLRVLPNWFRSSDDQLSRPALRQIIVTWISAETPFRMIISGTGVSMRELEKVISSAVVKEGGLEPRTVVKLGAFDALETQLGYLLKYCPQGFLETATGEDLVSRGFFWLHGRCVCSASIEVILIVPQASFYSNLSCSLDCKRL
jgi:hypothetical protein